MNKTKNNCVFCKIIAGELPSQIIFRDDQVTAFWDSNPLTPVHILIVPNKHIDSVNEALPEDEALMGHLITVAHQIAVDKKIDQSGYRLVINTGRNAGQSVFHLHLHLIGGTRMPVRFG